MLAVLAVLVVVGGAILSGWRWRPRFLTVAGVTLEHTPALIRSWGAWGALGSIGLMVAHSFLPFPAEVVAIANGIVYGPLWGSVITWVGAMLGASIAFSLGRRLGRPFVHRVLSRHIARQVTEWSDAHGTTTLLAARLVPLIAFNVINYAAALTTISWWTFLWTTALGILPFTILLNVLGARMLTGSPWIWLSLAGLVALAWAVIRRSRARQQFDGGAGSRE